MNSQTIKTLAEYIAKLHDDNKRREIFEPYKNDKFDTNGVEQDHKETSDDSDIRSRANP